MDATFGGTEPEDLRRKEETLAPFQTLAKALESGIYRGESLGPGDQIQHYRIIDRLGAGGMSEVFEAEHIYLKQKVALKTPLSREHRPEIPTSQFVQQAQVLAILQGPHVLRVQDATVFEDVPYVVTELLKGQSLSAYISGKGPLTMNQALDLLEQIGEVLVQQEKFGILHRDIKPANVWMRTDGSFCLFDYGLATFTATGRYSHLWRDQDYTFLGTPAYMPPEQARGARHADHRSDLYSLGTTFWHAITGQAPRTGKNVQEVISQLENQQVDSIRKLLPAISPDLERISSSLIAAEPTDRYQTAAEFVQDLERYRYGRQRPYGATLRDVRLIVKASDGLTGKWLIKG